MRGIIYKDLAMTRAEAERMSNVTETAFTRRGIHQSNPETHNDSTYDDDAYAL